MSTPAPKSTTEDTQSHSVPSTTGVFENIPTSEYIYEFIFFQQFKELALRAIDNFSYESVGYI
jgi:hypothetical protein